MTLAAGTRLGPYEILAPIGSGGMGEVYKARDTRLDRTVAIKVLPERSVPSADARQRFEREAKTISQLSHPHICALYDVGREGETEYLVMELLEGETVGERLARGALPLEQTLRYGVEIADALDKAHRQGIVHRDLKPANVMLTKSGVKLLDFGLAKAMAPVESKSADHVAADRRGCSEPDAGRHDPRDVPVHGTGATRGERGRRADGHLRAGRNAVRDGDGEEAVFGIDAGLLDRRDPAHGAAADLGDRAHVAARARPRRQDVSGEGSRGPVAVGRRRRQGAEVDRGRLGGRSRGAGRRRVAPPDPRGHRLGGLRHRWAFRRDPRRGASPFCGADARRAAGSCLHNRSREDDVSVSIRGGTAGALAGRQEARLRRRDLRRQAPSLVTPARFGGGSAACRDRGRHVSLLVAGLAFRRILCRHESEEDRRFRRAADYSVRCLRRRARRILEPGQHDDFCGSVHAGLPGLRCGGQPGDGHEV